MGKLGWTEYEYYTCSPYMFIAAYEGYFDKENERMALVRLQTLLIVQASGVKLKGGSDLKPTDLWLLPGEKKEYITKKVWGDKEDYENMKAAIEKVHGIKI